MQDGGRAHRHVAGVFETSGQTENACDWHARFWPRRAFFPRKQARITLFRRVGSTLFDAHPSRHATQSTPRTMFLLTPLKAAAVIASNCLFAKAYVTLRWRFYEANKLLGNLWEKAYTLPDTTKIVELQDGHLKQNATWKRVRATQLNEVEWAAIMLPLCLYFDSAGTKGVTLACSLMAWSQVGYTFVRAGAGYPFHMPFAVARYVGALLGVKAFWDAAF